MMTDLLGAHRDLARFKPTASDLATGRGAWRSHPRYRGCVGHWLLGEGGGRRAMDVSGYHNHGVLTGFTPSDWRSGPWGSEPLLDGVDDFITIPSAPQYDLSGDFTFSARARIDTLSGFGYDILLAKVNVDDDTQFFWSVLTTGNIYFFYYNVTIHEHTWTVPSIVEGQEYHYGLTCRGTSLQAYRDGIALGAAQTKTSTLLLNNGPLLIGEEKDTIPSDPVIGTVHDVRLYAVGLSAPEMRSLVLQPFLEFTPQRVIGLASTAGTPGVFPAWSNPAGRGYAPLLVQ